MELFGQKACGQDGVVRSQDEVPLPVTLQLGGVGLIGSGVGGAGQLQDPFHPLVSMGICSYPPCVQPTSAQGDNLQDETRLALLRDDYRLLSR